MYHIHGLSLWIFPLAIRFKIIPSNFSVPKNSIYHLFYFFLFLCFFPKLLYWLACQFRLFPYPSTTLNFERHFSSTFFFFFAIILVSHLNSKTLQICVFSEIFLINIFWEKKTIFFTKRSLSLYIFFIVYFLLLYSLVFPRYLKSSTLSTIVSSLNFIAALILFFLLHTI